MLVERPVDIWSMVKGTTTDGVGDKSDGGRVQTDRNDY